MDYLYESFFFFIYAVFMQGHVQIMEKASPSTN